MSINIKKYTKDQMAKMVEEAQAEAEEAIAYEKQWRVQVGDLKLQINTLKAKNAALTEQIDQMDGEAINKANEIEKLKADKANEIEKLKADMDSAKKSAQYLNDQGQQYWGAWQASKREVADLKNKLNDTEAALERANGECAFKQEALNVMRNKRYNAEQRANYAEAHPWRNLWAWVKRKLVRHE